MPLLGERHMSWVNDIKRISLRRLSLRDRLLTLASGLIMFGFFSLELAPFSNAGSAISSDEWLYLSSSSPNLPSSREPGWTNESPKSGSFWIMCIIDLEGDEPFNTLKVSLPDDHVCFWNGYRIGAQRRKPSQGLSQVYSLDKHHLIAGEHQILLFVQSSRSGFPQLRRTTLTLGKMDQFNTEILTRAFIMIACLGLTGLLIIVGNSYLRFYIRHPRWSIGFLMIIAAYLGFLFIETLHYRSYDWSIPQLTLITTLCCLQLMMALSNRLPKTTFRTYSLVASGSYVLIYFVLGTHDERVILYLLALWLTLFIFLLAHARQKWIIVWSLLPILPFLPGCSWIGVWLTCLPLGWMMAAQVFEVRPNSEPAEDLQPSEPEEKVTYLLVNSKSEKKSVALNEVVMIKAANNYAVIMLQSGDRFLHDKSLLKLSAELPDQFRRVHKSYLVNLEKVALVKNKSGGGKLLQMDNGEEVPVGRVYHKELSALFA